MIKYPQCRTMAESPEAFLSQRRGTLSSTGESLLRQQTSQISWLWYHQISWDFDGNKWHDMWDIMYLGKL